jgi:asparagine synthase (glutamine-hydrolysing)
MCGIVGIVGAGPVRARELVGMARLLHHRGPDDEGYLLAGHGWTRDLAGDDTPEAVIAAPGLHLPRARIGPDDELAAGVALGHRRLSILDLSPHGHQPMWRGETAIAFNGEIYDYLELRDELRALGHHFHTGTDTEVVLAAYAQWGVDCLRRMNGMWGFALLDLARRRLLLARDRFGVKPLYYRFVGGRLALASEPKAFTALDDWAPHANVPRLLDFLVWGLSDHGEETMFEGVRQLPPGHVLEVDVSGPLAGRPLDAVPEPRRWYALPPPPASPVVNGAEALRTLLDDAVRLRLRSDVPVGSCLSGGLDSSSIVCLMARRLAGGGHVSTFTAVSDDAAYDERAYAKAVVERTGSRATWVTPTAAGLLEEIDALVWHQDEPFLSSSIYAQWTVFRAARNAGVTVMLDGQGADETLCGYRGFFGAWLAGLLRSGRAGKWAAEVAALRREVGFSPIRSVGYTAAYLSPRLQAIAARIDGRAYADQGWIAPASRGAFADDAVRRSGGRPSSIREMSVAQIQATNLPMLLRWEDRNSMAFSVEARVPFLDYRMVELALSLDDAEKVGGGLSKGVLRRAMKGIVPGNVLDRRDKMGFVTAEPLWMRRDRAAGFREALADAVEVLPGILDPSTVDRFDEMVAGRRRFDPLFWRVICAGRWVRRFSVRLDEGGGT